MKPRNYDIDTWQCSLSIGCGYTMPDMEYKAMICNDGYCQRCGYELQYIEATKQIADMEKGD